MKFMNRHSSFASYLVAMLVIALIDVAVGIEINLWFFYGIPIGLATWNLGKVPGTLLATIGVVLLFGMAVIWGHPYTSLKYFFISYLFKSITYFVLVGLIAALRKKDVERVFTPNQFRK